MITLEKVNKYFNKGKKNQIHVINDTSLKLPDQGLVALLGESGCGKTTLLNVIGGLDKVKSGNIYINGQKITRKNTCQIDKIRNLNIGYIFQDYKLIDNLSVYDNVALALKQIGIKDKNEIQKRVNYCLETLGIYRFHARPASMLSGGERQRVGIARAIVKNPEVILADEPTGNLDSKNSLEIMKIIKSISKTKLVILVTHEVNLAHFYADRIIELEDGKILKDYKNTEVKNLDYRIENNIYLKDLNKNELTSKNQKIDIYEPNENKLDITLVVQNGNIYIQNHGPLKVEVIDENSNIKLLDEHYKPVDKEELNKYEFNFQNIINENYKKKYSSIFTPITFLTNGFKKITNYSVLKKILLLGYMAASMFILFSVTRIFATLNIKDSDFVNTHPSYINATFSKMDLKKYKELEQINDINYIIPGNSRATFEISYNTFFQSSGVSETINASLVSTKLIKEQDLIAGTLPQDKYEVVVDQMVLKTILSSMGIAPEAGINSPEKLIGEYISIPNMKKFKIVGIISSESPAIYADESLFTDILYNNIGNDGKTVTLLDYQETTYTLKEGKNPENDYEVIVPYSQRYAYKIGDKTSEVVGGKDLKVVGYYTSEDNLTYYITNKNTIKYELILNCQSITVSANEKTKIIEELNNKEINARDSYEVAKKEYLDETERTTSSILIFSAVIIAISIIEVFLMIRSSFLSRIKEVGTYRAIGVKKSDIYKMFAGEIIAISLTASLAGIAFMTYILYNITKIRYLTNFCLLTPLTIGISIILCFAVNLLFGLLPVANTIRKRPAEILSRKDI